MTPQCYLPGLILVVYPYDLFSPRGCEFPPSEVDLHSNKSDNGDYNMQDQEEQQEEPKLAAIVGQLAATSMGEVVEACNVVRDVAKMHMEYFSLKYGCEQVAVWQTFCSTSVLFSYQLPTCLPQWQTIWRRWRRP
jgi:hypothetical protein